MSQASWAIYREKNRMAEENKGLFAAKDAQTATMQGLKNQMNDLNDVRKQLAEAQAKEAKNVNQAKIDKVLRMAQEGDSTVNWILDNLSIFLCGNEKSSYNNGGSQHFSNLEAWQQSLQKVDHLAIGKERCEQLMKEITGGSSEGGAVAQALVLPDNMARYIDLYPFFKTLSKMVFLTTTMRKEASFKRKIARAQTEVNALTIKADLQTALMNQLDFYRELDREKAAIEEEYTFVKSKLAQTIDQIKEFEDKLEDFVESYFRGSIPEEAEEEQPEEGAEEGAEE